MEQRTSKLTSDIKFLKEQREYVLSERAKQEMLVNQWAEKLSKVDPLLLKDVDLPEDISLRTLIPELYKEQPDKEVYEEQYNKCMSLFNKVNEIADQYNKEKMKLIAEYRELVSG